MDVVTRDLQLHLQAILDCSRRILELANAREWQVLDEVESRRQRLLSELLARPLLPSEGDRVASCLQQVLTIDGEAVERMEAARRELVEGLKEIRLGRRAQLAYSENSR
jgi:hypothetical protein